MKPKVLITTHKNPDFDAFAASIAASLLYQDSIIIIDSEPQQNLKEFLNIYDIPYKKSHEFEDEFEEQIKNKNFDKIVVVDTSDINRIPESIKFLIEEGLPVDIYDHHPELKEQNINGNNFSKPVGSSTTILVEILFEKGVPFSDTLKTLFLIAIHEDTGNFVYPTTSWEDHDIAARLIKTGARVEEIEEFVSLEMTQEQKILFDKLYNNIEEFYLDEICVNIAYAESEKFIGGLNIITHKLFETLTPDVLFVIVKIAKTIYIVARSKSNQIDLNKILTSFGGGGHKKAGAAKVKGQSPTKVINKIKSELKSSFIPVLKAKHIMSSPVRTILSNETVQRAYEIMYQTGHSGLPVIENNKLVGMVTKKDIEKAMNHGLKNAPVKSVMSTNLKVADVETSLSQIRRMMAEEDIGRIPIIKDGILVGIITRTDLVRASNGVFNFSVNPLLKEKYESQNLKKYMEEFLPPSILNLLRLLGDYGNEQNVNVYVVGGFVRDLLLAIRSKKNNNTDIKKSIFVEFDIDIVVEAEALTFGRYAAKQLNAKYVEHEKFHTCSLFYRISHKIIRIDIATARTEYYEEAGELPTVEFSTIKKDLARRDFTINAMAIKLNPESFGILLDFFNSRKDLDEKQIRILHPLSFIEDPTRVLRAIRFEQRFGFEIEPYTLNKLIEAVEGKYLEKVTGMRLREEFEKILNEPEPLKAIERMGNLNIISHLFEKTYYTPTLQKELEKLFQVIDFFNNNLKSYTKNVRIFHVVLYVLVQYTPVESLKRVVQRYGLPKDYISKLQQVNSLYEEINDLIKESFGKQYKDIFKPSFFYERCSSLDNEQLIFMATKIPDDILSYFYNYLKKLDELTLLISGKDLLKKGYKGKEIKIKLEEIKKKLLDDEIKPGEELSLI